MLYKVEIKASIEKSLEKIPPTYVKKIKERIRLLATDPRHPGSIKLSGIDNAYRTRVGSYRIIYEIHESKVLVYVINVDHRKDVYK